MVESWGWQLSQEPAVDGVPAGGTSWLPMKHTDWHVLPLHTFPPPQSVPSKARVQSVVDVPGLHTWQGLAGSAAPLA